MENLRFNIAAGEIKVFVKAGRYFEILESSGPVTLAFYDANGSQNNDAGGVLSGTYLEDAFSQFDIYSATAQTVEILISNGKGGTRRQPGIVRVVDGEREKVLAGICFRGIGSQAGGGAGGALVQVFNPAGSGKNAFVQAVRAGASAADVWSLFSSTTQAPTLIGAGLNVDRTQSSAGSATRTGSDATAYAAVVSYATGYISAAQDVVLILPRPILLRPGQGLAFQTSTLATNLRATFEWEEWAI